MSQLVEKSVLGVNNRQLLAAMPDVTLVTLVILVTLVTLEW